MQTPFYLVDERRLRKNLELISQLSKESNVEFILALKAFALWKLFPIFKEYICSTTASSLYEAELSFKQFGEKCHTYSPAYEETTIDDIISYSSHLTFNSLTQFDKFKSNAYNRVSIGLRVNPEYSEIETDLYNPTAEGSRFGVLSSQLPAQLPKEIDGFHFHCHCESDSYAFAHTLEQFEKRFSPWLKQIKWLNIGGGHLVTHKNYQLEHFIETIKKFQAKYPHIKIIAEPGSAFLWETGDLHSKVVDIVENHDIKTAILNVSFTCHMPDCLEMPYHPNIVEATTLAEATIDETKEATVFRLGGNSCLSGDFMGYWRFKQPLKVGDLVVFKDMIHYTTVKTNMFNGIAHPAICLRHTNGNISLLKTWGYCDYRDRMC